MTHSRKFLLPLFAVVLLALTACGTANSMLPQPQQQQSVHRTIQDDTPNNPK